MVKHQGWKLMPSQGSSHQLTMDIIIEESCFISHAKIPIQKETATTFFDKINFLMEMKYKESVDSSKIYELGHSVCKLFWRSNFRSLVSFFVVYVAAVKCNKPGNRCRFHNVLVKLSLRMCAVLRSNKYERKLVVSRWWLLTSNKVSLHNPVWKQSREKNIFSFRCSIY